MEKVRVTQEQAEAIRIAVIDYGSDMVLLDRFRGGGSGVIEGISPVVLAKALYIGYEIEPEFKVGDWVEHVNGYVSKVTCVDERGIIATDHPLGYKNVNGSDAHLNSSEHLFRHATPEEIAKEKQRRWWKSHGRDVWELRVGDRLINVNTGCEHEVESQDNPSTVTLRVNDWTMQYTRNDKLELSYRVKYFAEDRKDIKS